ncbi:GtrA family protein [Candidatus Saccharibacteria bacterium]|nr:GtrA family protein [Candidatus Saccharibacteria bacterium]
MFKKLWSLYKEYEEIINYIISGGLGTIVNIGTFTICRSFDLDLTSSNVIAWVVTVIFIYLTSKFFVFKTADKTKKESTKEFVLFILARLATLGVEILLLNLTIEAMQINEFIAKTLSQVAVIILNYLLSKLVIFTKKS